MQRSEADRNLLRVGVKDPSSGHWTAIFPHCVAALKTAQYYKHAPSITDQLCWYNTHTKLNRYMAIQLCKDKNFQSVWYQPLSGGVVTWWDVIFMRNQPLQYDIQTTLKLHLGRDWPSSQQWGGLRQTGTRWPGPHPLCQRRSPGSSGGGKGWRTLQTCVSVQRPAESKGDGQILSVRLKGDRCLFPVRATENHFFTSGSTSNVSLWWWARWDDRAGAELPSAASPPSWFPPVDNKQTSIQTISLHVTQSKPSLLV